MNKIESFSFFKSYHEALKELCDRDKKALLVAIVNYVFDDITPDFKGNRKCVWALIEPTLRVSKAKADNARKKSNENQNEIKLKSNQKHNMISALPRIKEKDKEKDKEKGIGVSERNIKEKPIGFTSPTLTDIINFSRSINFDDEEYCERFYNHYQSVGWVNGAGIKIQDWKLLFKNWVKKDQLREQEKAKPQKSKMDLVFEQFMEEEDD